MSQIVRPSSDDSNDGWLNELVEPAPLWESLIEETADDDTSFIQRENDTETVALLDCTLNLPEQGAPEDQSADSHVLRYRWRMVAPAGTEGDGVFFVSLRKTGAEIVSATHSAVNSTLNGSWVTSSISLTAPQAAAITDYADLFVRFSLKLDTGEPGSTVVRVTQAWLEVPHRPLDAPPPISLLDVQSTLPSFAKTMGSPDPTLLDQQRPDADGSFTAWTDESGGTTNLYLSIDDEFSPDDSDHIKATTVDTNFINTIYAHTIGTPDSGVSGSNIWIVRWRYRLFSGDGKADLRVKLGETGYSVQRTFTAIAQTADWVDDFFLLTSGEVAGFTDTSDLRVTFQLRSSDGTSVEMKISASRVDFGPGVQSLKTVTPDQMTLGQSMTAPLLTSRLLPAGAPSFEPKLSKELIAPEPVVMGSVDFKHMITGGDDQFIGVFDDVQLFASPQGVDEEARLAFRELRGNESGLVEYWQFDTGSGLEVFGTLTVLNGDLEGTMSQWVVLDGSREVRGKRKPRVWGEMDQVEGVLEDHQRLVYRVNVGPTESIVPTEGGHESLTAGADLTNIYDSDPAPGAYVTQLSDGLIKFDAIPTGGPLAFVVKGAAPTDKGEGGYSDNAAIILRRIAQREAGVLAEDVDNPSFDLLAVSRTGGVGYSTGTSRVKIAEAMSALADTVDGWWVVDQLGKLYVGTRAEPLSREVADFEISDDNLDESGGRRDGTSPVLSFVGVRWGRREVIMSIDQVLGAVSDEERWGYTQQWRDASDTVVDRESFLDVFPEALTDVSESLYHSSVDADDEAERRLSLDQHPFDVYTFSTRHQVLRWPLRVGSVVRYSGRFAEDGRLMFLAGFRVEPKSGKLSLICLAPAEGFESKVLAAAKKAAFVDPNVTVSGAAGRGTD